MSQHKITACRSGSHPTMGDWDVEYVITYSYVPGSPDTYDASRGGPGGWDPGWAAEVEFISIEPDVGDHGAFTVLAQKDPQDWGANWLDEHYEECVMNAEEQSQPDPDAARDARIEDERDARSFDPRED